MPSDGSVSAVPWPAPDWSTATPAESSKLHLWANGEASFQDLLDTINPLQHLPIVSTIYGWITGNHNMGDVPRIAGDALYGGPMGALSGLFNALIKEETGKDLGEHAVALVIGDRSGTAVATAPADASAAPADAANASSPSGAASTGPAGATPATTPAPSSVPTAAASAPAASAATPPVRAPTQPVAPDHPPIPLFRSPTPVAGTNAPAPASSRNDPTARNFLAQTAARERQLYQSGTPTDSGRVLHSQPVALMVPPGSLPNGGRPRLQPASAVAPANGPTPASPNPDAPVDISQKMLDALDKYMTLQQKNDNRGGQVDVAP